MSCIWIISRLNNNKQILPEVVRALEEENKVYLMFLQVKDNQKLYARHL